MQVIQSPKSDIFLKMASNVNWPMARSNFPKKLPLIDESVIFKIRRPRPSR